MNIPSKYPDTKISQFTVIGRIILIDLKRVIRSQTSKGRQFNGKLTRQTTIDKILRRYSKNETK